MTLVVAFDSLYDNFEMTTTSFLHLSNKELEKIQQIVTSTEIADIAKRVVRAVADLTIMAKKNKSEKSDSRSNKKCFNYRKKVHYTRNCYNSTSNKRKSTEELTKEGKHTQ